MTETESRRVLLAGCGDVGTALGLRLSERGWAATGVRRHADRLPAPLAGASLDLTDPGEARLPDVDAVVVTLTADGHDVAGYEHTYLGGLRGLRRALEEQEPLVVLVSSTGVLGGGDGERVTETTPPDPQRPTAHVLLAAEELAGQLFPDLVIVRPAGIYGPGRTSMVERVRRGAPLAHRRVTNRIHRDDLVTVLSTLLERGTVAGERALTTGGGGAAAGQRTGASRNGTVAGGGGAASSSAPARLPRLLHAVDHDAALLGDVAAHLAHRLGVPVPPDDSGPGEGPLGKIVDGELVHALIPREEWRYPTFREGYDALLADGSADFWVGRG
ncbi:Rossmann-fold NAD(P)-binding domain-containing protein [Kocuria rhizophila]|uniref:NAD-dependent dehydratase n=1 Tax=Kocuria rhizophila TaxID=72000 RepID=UPI000C87C7DC|nr:NAD-dependent dehydratase [Kocuria rhizophila]MCT1956797.1 NAD-dependent dehydratase [Kocuria rhizophila]MCT2072737.1 NAD-dependent dehydratase [Kocuria rhizophila]PMR90741.1 NAD-dependent dehydratase [Kocuria rhizophila]